MSFITMFVYGNDLYRASIYYGIAAYRVEVRRSDRWAVFYVPRTLLLFKGVALGAPIIFTTLSKT